MRNRIVLSALTLMVIVLLSTTGLISAQSTGERKTVWSGVYTDAQAARGKSLYEANCSRCHGESLTGNMGNPLVGKDFMDRWREDNVEGLFAFVKASMPPNRNRNVQRVPLPDDTYIDIIGYVFASNKFPTGANELKLDVLTTIQVEGQLGPQPLPNGALSQVVGCMTKSGDNWTLTRASEPARTRIAEMATVEEIQAGDSRQATNAVFRLANFGYLGPDFKPEQHEGKRMLAKGTLVRQPMAERINLTSLTDLTGACPQ